MADNHQPANNPVPITDRDKLPLPQRFAKLAFFIVAVLCRACGSVTDHDSGFRVCSFMAPPGFDQFRQAHCDWIVYFCKNMKPATFRQKRMICA
jgi:hypothetical protein